MSAPFLVENDLKQKELAGRRIRAWRLAREAAALLKDRYGASEVLVFGSLAHGAWFSRWSDIDLAVRGIPDDRYYAAVAAVAGLSPEFKIDLIDLDDCLPSLRQVVVEEGIAV